MRFFIVAILLGAAGIVAAAPPAAATYCAEDNLLRAFQHAPTPASKYCITATGQPTFVAVTTYPASRLRSVCSCFSRFPTDGVAASITTTSTSTTSTSTSAACQPTAFTFTSTASNGVKIDVVGTFDRTQACGNGGYLITTLCGNLNGPNVDYYGIGVYDFGSPDYCYVPTLGVDSNGLDFEAYEGNIFHVYAADGSISITDSYRNFGTLLFPGSFVLVSCGVATPSCPAAYY